MKSLNFKSEKGSITLFVLIAVLFFSTVLLNSYTNKMNKSKEQNKDISRIQNIYDNIDANIVYQDTIQNLEENI